MEVFELRDPFRLRLADIAPMYVALMTLPGGLESCFKVWQRYRRKFSAIDHMRARLTATGFYREGLRAVGGLLWRGAILGTALYLLIGSDPSANLKLNGVSYSAAMIWCYYDGVFEGRKWSIAWFEGLILHLAGIQIGNILALIFGNPVLAG